MEEFNLEDFMKEFVCEENPEYLHVPVFDSEDDFIHFPKQEVWASTQVFGYEANDIIAVACKEGMAITISGIDDEGGHSIAFCRWFPEDHANCKGYCEHMLECWAKYKDNDLSFEDGDFLKVFPLDLSSYKEEEPADPGELN